MCQNTLCTVHGKEEEVASYDLVCSQGPCTCKWLWYMSYDLGAHLLAFSSSKAIQKEDAPSLLCDMRQNAIAGDNPEICFKSM